MEFSFKDGNLYTEFEFTKIGKLSHSHVVLRCFFFFNWVNSNRACTSKNKLHDIMYSHMYEIHNTDRYQGFICINFFEGETELDIMLSSC